MPDEEIRVLWNECQIMIIIYLKKQPKNSRFYSLVSFTKPHEKPWKRKHSSNLSPNISSLEDETKSQSTLICSEKKNQIFLHVVAIQAGQKIQSNLQRKQIFVICNACQDMLQNVDEIISQPGISHQMGFQSEIDKHWSWLYYTTGFLRL